jgi:hypothetical protein
MSINADTNADTNLVAEMYVPNIDNAGNYTDHIPAVNTGIRVRVVRERTRFIQDRSSPAH